ncbi:hypothetical protein OG948_55490 (plasmid) [Embleya sp. NBC_00888]|uniref:hypothetical protein n=1 Tax=Embleya sp. NBC_00888 TaxID=2975960 RepID=UPI002F909439|nr:hypothetical protein OG948_55490 [Embleya sp. NBC_00888]
MTDTTLTPILAARGRVHAWIVRAARTTAAHAVRGIASGAGSTVGGWLVWWLLHH